MAEQHSQTADYDNRWKFTGHELDRETGLYYAGARYYDPKVSVWLSVDPLAEKFASWNPYAYTFQNPINYIDPDGMQGVKPPNLSGIINVSNVLSGKKWIDYRSSVTVTSTRSVFGYEVSRSSETRSSASGTYECADYSRLQVKQGGGDYTAVGSKKRVDMYIKQGGNDSKLNLQKGIDTIVKNLKEGKAVMAGVMYDSDKNTGNANSATNHFVTIVGMGNDEEGAYFSYYDNFTGGEGEEVGTDVSLNKFRMYKSSDGTHYFSDGKDGNIPLNGNEAATSSKPSRYVLTEIRDNE
jgi:RHS repeat-associated protein